MDCSCITAFAGDGVSMADCHMPMNTLIKNVNSAPLTFGCKALEHARTVHTDGCGEVAGAFVGQGKFMTLSQRKFIVFAPKGQIGLPAALFPSPATHTMVVAEQASIYTIEPGAMIMTYNHRSQLVVGSVSVFLQNVDSAVYFERIQPVLGHMLRHMAAVLKGVSVSVEQVSAAKFATIAVPEYPSLEPCAKRIKQAA